MASVAAKVALFDAFASVAQALGSGRRAEIVDLLAQGERSVEEIAKEHKTTPAQLALAWVLAQGDDIVPIPGTRHPERVEENVRALDDVLSESDLRRIDAAAPKGAAAGERYAEGGMKSVNL